MQTRLPENANRPLKKGEKYEPILKPGQEYPEVTPYSVLMGVLMAVIFSAAAAYLGLKVGQVFTATVSCADSFCLLLRDREGLIGLGRNVPPGIN